MGTELTRVGAATLTAEQANLVRTTIFKGATPAEMQMYLHDCERQGVHPLDKLLHPQIRTSAKGERSYVAVTSIDLMRIRAAETGECVGISEGVFTGTPKTSDWACTVTVKRLVHGVVGEFVATARWDEYNTGKGLWPTLSYVLLAKCAEALALRKGFPRQLAGSYTKEEMAQAGEPDDTDAAKPARQAAQARAALQPPVPAPVAAVEAGPPLEAVVMPEEPTSPQEGTVGPMTWGQWIKACIQAAKSSGLPVPESTADRETWLRGIAERGNLACHADPWAKWSQGELSRLCELCGDPFAGE